MKGTEISEGCEGNNFIRHRSTLSFDGEWPMLRKADN